MKYTVIDKNGDNVNILIKNTLYVPTLHTPLLSLQQLAQQSEDRLAGAHILGDALHLRWDYHENIVLYHSVSNLQIIFTVPEGKRASAYIVNRMHYWHRAYLSKDDKKMTWNNDNIIQEIKGYNENIEDTIDSALMTNDEIEETIDSALISDELKDFIPSRKAKAPVILGEIRHHEPVTLPVCGDCDPDQEDLGRSCKNKECKDCTVSFDSLDNAQRTLLY